MVEQGLSPGTTNTRLVALRSIVKDARRFGLINWSLDVKSVRSDQYRDTLGPGEDNYKKMLGVVLDRPDSPKRSRDLVILRLLHDMGLRRSELGEINLDDIDFQQSRVAITPKGKTERHWLTIPRAAVPIIQDWLRHRGSAPGPLLTNLDRAAQNPDRRLSGAGIYKLVSGYGAKVGRKTRPHALRHQAATTLLNMGHDIRAVQRFTRHAKLDTVVIYDDRRKDVGGQLANELSEA
jgi:integrase/recombinase XerC